MAKRVRTKFQTLCIDFQQSNNGPKRILPRGQPIPVVAGRFDGTGQKQKEKQNGNGASLEGNPPLRESTSVVGTDGPKVPAVPKYSDILSGKAKAPPQQPTALTPAQKSSAAGYGANPGQSDKNKNAILSASQKAKKKRKNDPLWSKKKPSKYLPKLEDFIMAEKMIRIIRQRVSMLLQTRPDLLLNDAIYSVVSSYNNEKRTPLGNISPSQVNKGNYLAVEEIFARAKTERDLVNLPKSYYPAKFKVGDRVFIRENLAANPFRKIGQPRYNPEVCVVESVISTEPLHSYVLKSLHTQLRLIGTFPENRLVLATSENA